MTTKQWLASKPYWLKGGVLGVVFILLYYISFEIFSKYFLESAELLSTPFVFPFVLSWVMFSAIFNVPLDTLASMPENDIPYLLINITAFVILFFFYFLAGALIGYVANNLKVILKNIKIIFKKIIKTILVKTSLLPAIIIFVITPIILFPPIIWDFNSMWDKSEFYFFTFCQILFFLVLSVYTYFNIKKNYWTQKYLVNAGILIAIGFYYYESLSYSIDIPMLVILSFITIIFIIPALLILQLIAILIKKYFRE